ncbi:nuclear transport factor 2 family protein [Paraburkholderia dilworthii]|uniref:nuclear transport factor 2 family protein n=1 Tax=Paraburkholderia dilworthii TaxID=948106 RepID=UPI0003F57843|nr:nuclear transport factor 2 family protein [Paraburkholderia dilworthii]
MRSFALAVLTLVLALAGCAADHAASSSASPPAGSCKVATNGEIAALFDRWNESLQTGDPHKVVANYAERSILLATISNKPRLTVTDKEDYFHYFLQDRPSGKIDFRFLELGCNSAVDAGVYTFTFARTGVVVKARYTYTYRWDGTQWLITSHHSSAMPEKE